MLSPPCCSRGGGSHDCDSLVEKNRSQNADLSAHQHRLLITYPDTELSSCCGVNELGACAQNDLVLMHELSGAHARAERALAQINQLTLSIGPGVDDLGADAGAGWGT